MLKIARVLDGLSPDDQRIVAFEVYRTYGGALSGAQRQVMYRTRARNDRVTESPPGSDAAVTPESNDRVTETSHLPIVVLEASVSKNLETTASKNQKLRKDATEVLRFLNEKTSRSFRYVDGNLRMIEARLKTGATVQDCKSVIARQCRAWLSDPKMSVYLRPETLFNATKFESYRGLAEAGHD